MALRDENVDVWRPVQAERIDDESWRIVGPVPEGEAWEFQPGEIVGLEERTFSEGAVGLVAVTPRLPGV